MKRWMAIVLLGAAWLHDGLAAMEWRERAREAEVRAAEAESWAETVATEAALWLGGAPSPVTSDK